MACRSRPWHRSQRRSRSGPGHVIAIPHLTELPVHGMLRSVIGAGTVPVHRDIHQLRSGPRRVRRQSRKRQPDEVIAVLRPAGYLRSKLPSFTPARNSCHSSCLSVTTVPPGFAELRTMTASSVVATSTHAPLSHALLRRHTRPQRSPSVI